MWVASLVIEWVGEEVVSSPVGKAVVDHEVKLTDDTMVAREPETRGTETVVLAAGSETMVTVRELETSGTGTVVLATGSVTMMVEGGVASGSEGEVVMRVMPVTATLLVTTAGGPIRTRSQQIYAWSNS